MRESTIEKYLVKKVKECGGEIRKLKWIGRRGAPDRLVGFRQKMSGPFVNQMGNHILIELKATGKKPDAHQLREIEKLRNINFQVWVIDSKRKVDKFIDYYACK